MKRAVLGVSVLCLILSGCEAGVLVSSVLGDSSWALSADDTNALVDAKHLNFGSYPNPRNVARMRVTVEDDGRICADDGSAFWCGGPLQGIPYLAVLNKKHVGYCVRVVDIFGNKVRSGCTDAPLPDGIVRNHDPADQQPLEEEGVIPGNPKEYVDTLAETSTEETTTQEEKTPSQDSQAVGATLVIDEINASLEKIGLKSRVSMPEGSGFLDFESGDITLGDSGCKEVLEYLDDEFSDDHVGTDDYIFDERAIKQCLQDGECRIGQIVTRAMAAACEALPSDVITYQAEAGIVGAGGHAVDDLCNDNGEIDKCVGSPLVLDLAGNGLQLVGLDAGVSFPLAGTQPMSVGWLAGSDDALLAVDLDGDGAITSGRELFGERSGGWAPDGFAALARYDDNHDGVISASDAIFDKLLAWRDNGDGRSTSDELLPLAALGIRSIGLSRQRVAVKDAFGNQLGLLGGAQSDRNEQIPVIDVWFRMRAR